MENLDSGNIPVADVSQPTSAPEPQQQVISPQPSERTYTQHEVNQMVSGAKAKAAEKARSEVMRDYQPVNTQVQQQYQEQPYQQQQSQTAWQQQPQSRVSDQDIDKLIEQRLDQRRIAESSDAVAKQIAGKMEASKEKYEDYEKTVLGRLNPQRVPDIYLLANKVENSGDVLYALATNPTKAAEILSTLERLGPDAAEFAMEDFAKSLHQINNAQETFGKNVPEPTSTLRQTSTGFANKEPGLRDLKAKYTF